jgi:exosortase
MSRLFPLGSLLGFAIALASCPLVCLSVALLELVERHPAYHFFPLPLAIMVWLCVQNLRKAEVDMERVRCALGSRPLLYFGHLGLSAAALLLNSPFLCGLAFLGAVIWLVRVFDFGATSREVGWWFVPVLALFVIPPPMALDYRLQDWLAHATAQLSHPWLDALGVFHAREGVIFVTPFKRFFVDDACSGSNSFFTMSCMAISASALFGCTGFHALLSMLTAMLGSIAVNMSRIVLVVYAQRWGWELEKGLSHEVLGHAMFLGGMAVVLSAHFGWAFILHGRAARPEAASGAEPTLRPPQAGWLRGWSLALCVVAAPLLAAGVTLRAKPLMISVLQGQETALADLPDLKLSTPELISVWKRETDQPTQDEVVGELGVRNLVWRYRAGERVGYIGTSYPFTGFHDTRVCYRNSGWEIRGTRDLPLSGGGSASLRLLEMHHTGSMRQATLGLALLTLDGRPLPFPADENSAGAERRLVDRAFGSLKAQTAAEKETTVVVQFLLPVSAGGENDETAITQVLQSLAVELGGQLQQQVLPNGP